MYILLFGINSLRNAKFLSGYFAGSRDELVSQFSDNQIEIAVGLRDSMEFCVPWSQHITDEGVAALNSALKANDSSMAKKVIDNNLTETFAPWCIELLKVGAVSVCTTCPKILKDAMPTLL